MNELREIHGIMGSHWVEIEIPSGERRKIDAAYAIVLADLRRFQRDIDVAIKVLERMQPANWEQRAHQLREAGYSYRQIGNLVGVSGQRVHQILSSK